MKKIKFSKDFWFGAATSGPQTEGDYNKSNPNIFDDWYKKDHSAFWNGLGPDKTCDTYNKYAEDIQLMKFIGLNSFRTSIQWTRLIKNFETMEVDEDGLMFYTNYFESIKKANIILVVNLFHFDMPVSLAKLGGFENREVIYKFSEYAKICFQKFGNLVDYFTTFNEPVAAAENQYLYGYQPPFVKDFKRFIAVSNNTMLAHSLAVQEFRNIFGTKSNKQIGIILNLTPSYPKNLAIRNIKASMLRDLIFNKFFLDAVIKGKYPIKLIKFLTKEKLMFPVHGDDANILENGKIDYLGVNYYQPSRIKKSCSINNTPPWNWFETYRWSKGRFNPYRGWEIHPKTIYKIGILIKKRYTNIKWYISENGMGVESEHRFKDSSGVINDSYRIDFIKEHLYWLNKAINKNSNCFGYHVWTFIDCWSWANSFKNRYGLVELDLEKGIRNIKYSALWYKTLCSTKELTIKAIKKSK